MTSVAFVNRKGGTAKTTCAVWLAQALHDLGHPVLLVDADPAASALEWSDLAGGFAFRLVGLPTKDVGRRIAEFTKPGEIVVIDAPQMEDHGAIVRSVLHYAAELVIPVAPNGIELARMAPVLAEIDGIQTFRELPARVSILLTRINRSSNVAAETREDLIAIGYHVLDAMVSNVLRYSQSFGLVPKTTGTEFAALASELLARNVVARKGKAKKS